MPWPTEILGRWVNILADAQLKLLWEYLLLQVEFSKHGYGYTQVDYTIESASLLYFSRPFTTPVVTWCENQFELWFINF